ncbi:MAG: DUF5330 domain-containing protein [Hyphomicrobium sp.]|nr:DUF5330 domain-containing protein [Hyphomicrobium sp.]
MGLFKLAAVVAVGVSLLPAEREKQEQLYQRAASAAAWTLTFCDRNAGTCNKASGLWGEFSKKAEFGAKLAYDVLREKQPSEAAAPPNVAPASLQSPPPQTAGTLTPNDLRPAWRGKTASKAGI